MTKYFTSASFAQRHIKEIGTAYATILDCSTIHYSILSICNQILDNDIEMRRDKSFWSFRKIVFITSTGATDDSSLVFNSGIKIIARIAIDFNKDTKIYTVELINDWLK